MLGVLFCLFKLLFVKDKLCGWLLFVLYFVFPYFGSDDENTFLLPMFPMPILFPFSISLKILRLLANSIVALLCGFVYERFRSLEPTEPLQQSSEWPRVKQSTVHIGPSFGVSATLELIMFEPEIFTPRIFEEIIF